MDKDKASACWGYFENLPEWFYNNMKQKQRHANQESHSERPHSDQLTNILKQLCILEYFPARLSMETALSFRDNMFEKPKDVSDIPWFIIRNIISINFNFRDTILEECIHYFYPEVSDESDTESKEKSDDSDTGRQSLSNMHPLDIFLAIFQCCDPFFKMVIVQKMFLCQLAIPMIFPDFVEDRLTFSLWPIREIVTSTGESITTKAMKTVTFMRIGDGRLRSKSKFINEIIRCQGQQHKTFFDKDCSLGNNNRMISNGLVETSWYVPSSIQSYSDVTNTGAKDSLVKVAGDSKQTDKLKDTLTIFNLRGNAADYDRQRDLLVNISTLIVLLIKCEYLENESNIPALSTILNHDASVILVTTLPSKEKHEAITTRLKKITETDASSITIVSTFDWNKNKNRNASQLNKCLWRRMFAALQKSDRSNQLADISRYLPDGIVCDENNDKCATAKLLVDDFISLERYSAGNSNKKDVFLPLQGQHWQKWSDILRKQSRSGQTKAYDVDETQLKTMQSKRMKQVEQCNRSPILFAKFIQYLVSLTDDIILLYFLTWLRLHMDTESRKVLPQLQKAFHDAMEKHEQGKSKTTQRILDKADQRLVDASFGIEHFFREIGQMYEAFMYTEKDTGCQIQPKTRYILEQLPKVVARLLLLGQPLEIMDGDVASVPTKWIQAVCQALVESVGDKRIFAISILGVLSTGKSTLLNTMFGLQFAVSAGRCTRGMNMQLVHVDQRQSSLPFEYAMVIDTEGLRALEFLRKCYNRDNELATLVFGLGDVIILNIMGESLAEMQSILETVVHALLRLKQANDKLILQKFIFLVHENVSAPNAKMYTQQGHNKAAQNFDSMTKDVASHLHMSHITSFNQVINFKPLLHVKYIQGLWLGSPPMAPANPSYSEMVTELTQCILRDMAMSKTKNTFLMSDICPQLEALWKGILSEDFIFSFRNCLEVKAYSLLESIYQQLVWKMEKKKLHWCKENIQPVLGKCKSNQSLDTSEIELITQLKIRLSDKARTIVAELTEYCKTSELHDQMIHWKEGKIRSIDSLATRLEVDATKMIGHAKELFMHKLNINAERSIKEKEINKQAIELAHSLKGTKPSETELDKRFDGIWNVWLTNIAPPTTEEEHKQPIKQEIKAAIYDKYKMNGPLIEQELRRADIDSGYYKTHLKNSICASDIKKEHINLQGVWKTEADCLKAFRKRESNLKQQVLDTVNRIFYNIDTYIADLSTQDTAYENTQFSQILNYITDPFNSHNDSKSHNEFTMTPVLQIKVTLQAARYAFKKFALFNETYQKKHSLRLELMAYKPAAWQLFKDTVDTKTEDIMAANALGIALKSLIQQSILSTIPIKMKEKMNDKYSCKKYYLMLAVLRYLAEKDTVNDYITYLESPSTFVLKWITDETINTVFETEPSLFMQWVNANLVDLIGDIKQDAMALTNTDCPLDINGWVTSFRQRLEKHKLVMLSNTFDHVTVHPVSDFRGFLTYVIKQLSEKEKEIQKYFYEISSDKIEWIDGVSPYQNIFELLWGCTELCPWCNEPCQKADAAHAVSNTDDCHTCMQHRPAGLGGVSNCHDKKLSIESCNFNVHKTQCIKCGSWCECIDSHEREEGRRQPVWHKFRHYKRYIPGWDIAPSSDMSSSKYWTWFFVKHNVELAAHYHLKPADIPDSWKTVTKADALISLV